MKQWVANNVIVFKVHPNEISTVKTEKLPYDIEKKDLQSSMLSSKTLKNNLHFSTH